jgi:hypothetical protein
VLLSTNVVFLSSSLSSLTSISLLPTCVVTSPVVGPSHGHEGRGCRLHCRMDLPGPTTSVGTRTDYSVGPWDYSTCAAQYLMA